LKPKTNAQKEHNMTDINQTITQQAIAANLAALRERLSEAERLAFQACQAMSAGNQNEAMGAALNLERLLPEASALYSAASALHRSIR
jgi:hypothetical protein